MPDVLRADDGVAIGALATSRLGVRSPSEPDCREVRVMRVRAGALSLDAAASFAERTAIEDPRGAMSFAELDRAANRVATGLGALGIELGERVAVLAPNRAEVVELWLGCERAGLVRVVLHSHIDMALHCETLRASGASAVIFDARFAEEVAERRQALKDVRLFVAIGGDALDWAVSFEELRERGTDHFDPIEVDEDAPFCIQPTTGTTGAPKPWLVTHRGWRALVAHNLMHLDALGPAPIDGDDVNLHVHALQWASGAQTLLPYMVRGAKSLLLDDAAFDPMEIVKTILQDGVTGLLLPGPMLSPVLDVMEAHEPLEHRLRRLVTLFATPELLQRATRILGPVWCHGYGSTEQGAPVTRLAAREVEQGESRIGSVGRKASPFIELAIVDDAGDFLPPGTLGEIVVRSPMSSSSYWRRSALSAAAAAQLCPWSRCGSRARCWVRSSFRSTAASRGAGLSAFSTRTTTSRSSPARSSSLAAAAELLATPWRYDCDRCRGAPRASAKSAPDLGWR